MISLGTWVEAARLCREIDPADIAFVALALQLNGKLWTRDAQLRDHLARNGFTDFFIDWPADLSE